MTRSCMFVLLMASGTLACLNPTGVTGPNTRSAVVDYVGVMTVDTTEDPATLFLQRDDDGSFVPLAGGQAPLMLGLDNAKVSVHGVVDTSGVLNVQRFLVLAVNGQDAIDGTLVAAQSAVSVRLTVDGSLRPLSNPCPDLTALVGRRVWIVDANDQPSRAYGVIAANATGP